MPKVRANGFTMHYEREGTGEPLLLIPYTTALGSVPEMVILGVFPWCFTPELYAARPDYLESLAAFVRSRPPQTLDAFLQQANAVVTHDVESQLGRITAPTLITCGRHDMLTARFVDPLKQMIPRSEVMFFEGCAHAPLYEKVEEFNEKTLQFLERHRGHARLA